MTPNPDHVALHAFVSGGVAGPMTTSPLLVALGASLDSYDAVTGQLVMGFAPSPLFRQGAGFVQGGALAAMLDFVMAFGGMAAAGADHSITTASMATHFLAGATADRFRAIGEVEKAGRRLIHVRGRLEADGRSVASASSTLLVI